MSLFSLHHPRRNETINWFNVRLYSYPKPPFVPLFLKSRVVVKTGTDHIWRASMFARRIKEDTQADNCPFGILRPSFRKESLSKNEDVNYWVERYLGLGEWVMDQSVAVASSSGWFERKR